MRRLRDFWFGEADVAPVAVFRILFGLLLFNWFWQLYPNLTAFFTDAGILPRSDLASSYPDRLSVLSLSGEGWVVAAIWAVSCVVALSLAAGAHTRLASLLSFLLLAMLPFERTRSVAAFGAAAMQLGILLLMNVGNFPLVMLVACVMFVPPRWIHRVMREAAVPAAAPAVRGSRRRAVTWLLAIAAAAAFVTAVPSEAEALRPSGDLASLLRSLSLDQRWDMFSPNAARSDWWLVAPA